MGTTCRHTMPYLRTTGWCWHRVIMRPMQPGQIASTRNLTRCLKVNGFACSECVQLQACKWWTCSFSKLHIVRPMLGNKCNINIVGNITIIIIKVVNRYQSWPSMQSGVSLRSRGCWRNCNRGPTMSRGQQRHGTTSHGRWKSLESIFGYIKCLEDTEELPVAQDRVLYLVPLNKVELKRKLWGTTFRKGWSWSWVINVCSCSLSCCAKMQGVLSGCPNATMHTRQRYGWLIIRWWHHLISRMTLSRLKRRQSSGKNVVPHQHDMAAQATRTHTCVWLANHGHTVVVRHAKTSHTRAACFRCTTSCNEKRTSRRALWKPLYVYSDFWIHGCLRQLAVISLHTLSLWTKPSRQENNAASCCFRMKCKLQQLSPSSVDRLL